MEKNQAIGISLQVKEEIIDLQIPIQVTITRLKELLKEALTQNGSSLPDTFDLVVLNKPIRLKEEAYVADYPLSEGDHLLIHESQQKAEERT
ncbi:type VII secretion protein, YukD family [Enterococcus sp. DIV1298c]|uniref:Type VII secretion protein, YukD family n=1 Tax=Candidatus Enterococcus mangumiae TaxID=2230878 RepID=A0ABZ2SUP5_9ENTE|nr:MULTISPECIES: type VII secretion protein, YukD family [unclassified Enterococcus]MBO0461707.1 type VII secretion protein, YukD family [Enterococcus sp. DIV1298c]MBO0488583.1 type VII secretion protein, YukD family [Enterococcus sp. DIV1094]